jgi:hypothetical protein
MSTQTQTQVSCVRFQYQKGTVNPPPFETLPFYLVKIRSFLKRNLGHAAWFKGNTGGGRAAWLLYDTTVSDQVDRLLTDPLDSGGYFKVTASIDSAAEIMTRYIMKEEMEIVGSLELPTIIIGKETVSISASVPWWETFDWKRGFWMSVPKLSILASDIAKKHYNHISADHVTAKEDKKGIILGLHNYVETSLNLRGVGVNQLIVDQEADDENGNPSFYLWEKDVKKWIEEDITIDQVVRDEPSWKDYLDAVKIGG